jgi:DNA mismatch repair protein MutL
MEALMPGPEPRGGAADRIRVLPDALAMQIAAGEVIERPASVVKELVENALDAGARRIVVELEDGGLTLIRVIDDGIGIAADDAALAFTRHATSKIREAADLTRIATLGFRGEALPSIAAVAAVELVTRVPGADAAVRVEARDGAVHDVRAAGAAAGTSVTVRALFASVPARRKFLKSTATELGHVVELVTRQSLVATDVHFRLLHQGREIAAYPPAAGLEERARQVFGRERAHGGRVFANEGLGIAVRGFLMSPQRSFASARSLYTYVNGRVVRDRALSHAIVEGYASLIPRGRWPGAVVLLECPPGDVDVNVHPAKHEVRFRLGHVIHERVLGAVRAALASTSARAVPDGGAPGERSAGVAGDDRGRADAGTVVGGGVGSGGVDGGVAEALRRYVARHDGDTAVAELARGWHDTARAGPLAAADPGAAVGYAGLRFVGQVFRGYIVCEGRDRLVLIDQHAAHERVAFERLRDQHRTGSIERQALLIPVTVDVGPAQAEALLAALPRLEALGFEVESFGDRTFLVRALPALLAADDPQLLLEDLADGLSEIGSELSAAEAIDAILGRIACHSVVRVGQALAPAEVEALLGALDALHYGSNCPHGRPVAVEYTRGQLERMFGR